MGAVLAAQCGHNLAAHSRSTQRVAQPGEYSPRGGCAQVAPPVRASQRSERRRQVDAAATRSWDVGCRLAGSGSAVPASVLTNKDLERLVETNDEWIATRTGIRYVQIVHCGTA